MPIKGLSDRGLSFPEIGQVRKGAKKNPEENKPGKDLTYFRVEFDSRELTAAQLFEKTYGKEPTEIHIILPFNDIDRMWEAWLEAYTAGRMVARSDGEKMIYQVDTATGELLIRNGLDKNGNPRPYIEGESVGKDYKGKDIKCRPVGRLKIIVPELARAAYLTVMTTSYHDIANLSAQLEAFKQLNNGQIAGIPLVLRRRPKMISRPAGNGSRVRTEKWLLSIEADPAWVKAKLGSVKHLALPEPIGAGDSEPIIDVPFSEVEEEDFDPPSVPEGMAPDPMLESSSAADLPVPSGTKPAKDKISAADRPFDPETTRSRLLELAGKHEQFTPTEAQRSLLVYGLKLCFVGEDEKAITDKRHIILNFLTGHSSSKEVDGITFKAVVENWLRIKQDPSGDYTIDPLAAAEAQAIVNASLITEGQVSFLPA
jgi:hypothetical protein